MRSRRLTLKQYLQFPHALVETLAGQQTLVDRPLAQLGAKRHVVFSLPFFVPAIFAIAQTDLVLTLPRKLAKIAAGMAVSGSLSHLARSRPFRISWPGIRDLQPKAAHAWFREQVRIAARTI